MKTFKDANKKNIGRNDKVADDKQKINKNWMLVEVMVVYKIVKKSTPGFTHVEEVKKITKQKRLLRQKINFC